MSNRQKPNLTDQQLRRLMQELLFRSFVEDGTRKLERGAMTWAGEEFNLLARHVSRLWKKACDSYEQTGLYSASPKKKGNSGRNIVYVPEDVAAIVGELHRKKWSRKVRLE